MASSPTRIMMGVNESSIKGYPHASISSSRAFEWTIEKIVRSNSSGFRLLFLHVQVTDEDAFEDMDSIYASPEDFQSIKQRDKIRGLHLLEYFVGRCHQHGIPCEAWIRSGDPKEVICSEVKRVQPDILVVGNRGLGPLQSHPIVTGSRHIGRIPYEYESIEWFSINVFKLVFLGTVSEFCVKHANCPVISIKRNADEAPEDPVDD